MKYTFTRNSNLFGWTFFSYRVTRYWSRTSVTPRTNIIRSWRRNSPWIARLSPCRISLRKRGAGGAEWKTWRQKLNVSLSNCSFFTETQMLKSQKQFLKNLDLKRVVWLGLVHRTQALVLSAGECGFDAWWWHFCPWTQCVINWIDFTPRS